MQYKNKKKNKNKTGFTLVEMMVSVAIFSIIMVVGIGALSSIMDKYQASQKEKKAADSLSFVLETITREVRLGTNYYSVPSDLGNTGIAKNGTATEADTNLLGFDAASGRGYVIYFIQNGALFRRNILGGVSIDEPLTDSSQVYISKVRIRVLNADDPTDLKQPLVWIQFLAYPPGRENSLKVIQTLASQRMLDA